MRYHFKLWDKLVCYVEQGFLEIDTNLVENAIRLFALGEKNWLFQGNTRGAEAASIIYSLVMTCKANRIEPYAYLKYVLYQLPKIQPEEHHRLLPHVIQSKSLTLAYQQAWV